MFIDSHCHLQLLEYGTEFADLDQVILACKEQKITELLSVAISNDCHQPLIYICEKYEKKYENKVNIHISAGVHPSHAPGKEIDLELLIQQADHPKVIAIGETGLDYHYLEGEPSWQQERFVQHIEIATQVQKPLIIHTRAAKQDTISLMRSNNADNVSGVMHCFTEDWEMAKQALDLGFYISFSGIITFKNADSIREVLKKTPLNRILIETDSPYLAPTPKRGKPNYPTNVVHVAECVANLRNLSVQQVASITMDNYYQLFPLQK